MDITNFSHSYEVRRLTETDIPAVCELCKKNELYYEYCPPMVTEESIQGDMNALPPGKTQEEKFYVGFYDDNHLIAVMDLILDYPEEGTAYIGFFMTDTTIQNKGIGSRIIDELWRALCAKGYTTIGLGWVQGNPQPEHFWLKNGFEKTGKVFDMDDFSVVDARKYIVLPVTEDNLTDAARIHSISWQESHRAFCDEAFILQHDVNHQAEYIRGKMNDGSRFYLLRDKEPVAVVSITDGLIEDLYVLPEQQNQGYGTALLDYVITQIQKDGITPTLWILENNQGAERLYRRKGFVPTGKENAITNKLSEIEFIYQE